MLNLSNINSIAVVGASADVKKLGSVILQNILNAGFKGFVYPINPNYKQVLGIPCFESLLSVPTSIDLVVVVIPSAAVLNVAMDAGKMHTKTLIVISAGFAETGEIGVKLQADLLKICNKYNMNLIGPNCLGIQLPHSKINASFGGDLSLEGSIALVSQSGAIITALQDMAWQDQLGFSHIVSLGNKAGINELDLLKSLSSDPKVKVVAMYLEDFVDGNDFVNMAAKCSKPIVVLKPGVTTAGAAAASSHTGALVGSPQVIATALKKAGVYQVSNIEQFYTLVKLLNAYPNLKHISGVSVVTNAGGPGVMFTDMLYDAGVSFTALSDSVVRLLSQSLPTSASVKNPIDILGDADAQRYLTTTSVLASSKSTELIIAMLTPQYVTEIQLTAEYLNKLHIQTGAHIVGLFLGGKQISLQLKNSNLQIPIFNNATGLCDALGLLSKHIPATTYVIDSEIKPSELISTKKDGGVSANLVEDMLQSANLVTPYQAIVSNVNELSKTYEWPMVVKADSSVIAHKTEQKAVVTNIQNITQLKTEVKRLIELTKSPVLVQQQIENGIEIFVGLLRDGDENVYTKQGKGFGHLITFGLGGIYTELIGNHVNLLAPTSKDSILMSLQSNKAWPLLNGYRTGKTYAVAKLVNTIYKLQQLVLTNPQINILEVNPIILTSKECYIVDAKVWIK